MSHAKEAVWRSYQRMARKHPPLSVAEEVRIGTLSLQGDSAARLLLFKHNVAFALMLARQRSYASGVALDDLVQEAMIGLHKAVERFDPARKRRFTTYATWWIRAYLGRYVKEHRTTLRQPTVKPGQERIPLLVHQSLDAPVRGSSDETFLDFLVDANADPAWETIRKLEAENIGARLTARFARMRGVEQDIVLYRLLSDEKILEEVGAAWDLSRERVRQIQKQLIPHLQRLLADYADE